MSRMMGISAVVALAALSFTTAVWAADSPLKRASVGEWTEYLTRTETMGQTREIRMKKTVVAKDAVSVTLRTATSMMGKEVPPQDVRVMLDQPYEPYKTGHSDATVTQLGEGSETITVGGNVYICHWVKVKTIETKPQAVESTTTVWASKDVPVSGMVKMESEASATRGGKTVTSKTTMELTGAGK
jgi:hypothetical protein